MRGGIKRESMVLSTVLFVSILSVWALFSAITSQLISAESQSYAVSAADRIAEDLSHQFANLERLCYTLSIQPDARAMVTTSDTRQRMDHAGQIDALLLHGNLTTSVATHFLLTVCDGWFSRLA